MISWIALPARATGGDFRPAMIGNGANSVAVKLHYPLKERAANRQAAITFNCEVRPDGKATQISVRCNRKLERFGDAVNMALRAGRFEPAEAGGKPVDIAIGGTALFTVDNGKPVAAISLVSFGENFFNSVTNIIS